MKSGKLSKSDKDRIKELLKTSYDAISNPPNDYLNSVTHIVSHEPKNFTTLNIQEIEDKIIQKFSQSEDLIHGLSNSCINRLKFAIRGCYYGDNVIDLAEGGNGVLVPPFAKIMSEFIVGIKLRNLIDLKNDNDKAFYGKYFWCFELECQIIADLIQKAS